MNTSVPSELVEAALAAARQRRTDVATVPLTVIAAAAGISRSTLLRRLGGTRATLDEAVRAAGVDPGGRQPVRERAVYAAGRLIGERGLGSVTLDSVADKAQCSLPSLHTTFGGRDGLLAAVFERYSPLLDLERLAENPPASLESTVRTIYRALITAFSSEPRVMPAMLSDVFARPGGPGSQMFQANFPRLFSCFGALLLPHVDAGRLRPLPLPLLIQQMLGPMIVHLALRPVLEPSAAIELPDLDHSCDVFTDAFLNAVAAPNEDTTTTENEG